MLVITAFGRTARLNGPNGTDHETANVALVLRGTVAGGKVGAIWPCLRDAQSY